MLPTPRPRATRALGVDLTGLPLLVQPGVFDASVAVSLTDRLAGSSMRRPVQSFHSASIEPVDQKRDGR